MSFTEGRWTRLKVWLRELFLKAAKKLKNNYWIYDQTTGQYIKPNGGKTNGKNNKP